MKMDKVIKEFKENEITYKLGYDLLDEEVYPRIEIYKNEELLSGGDCVNGIIVGLFFFYAYGSASDSDSDDTFDTIKEMFNKLRGYSEIPEYIEKEFESLFLLYKLNDFKEN